MNANPKISVIVPVYNTEKYLKRCIDSILAQSFSDFELLLIDDGSTDASPAICDEYAAKDTRVRVFHKPNGGVSSARNIGIENTQGNFITFIDADDWIAENYLRILYRNDNIDFSMLNYRAIGWNEWEKREYHNQDYNESTLNLFLNNYLISCNTPWGKLFKRCIILDKHIRFNEMLSYGEDTLFVIEYLKNVKSVHLDNYEGYYYNCENQLSLSRSVDTSSCLYLVDILSDEIRNLGEIVNFDWQRVANSIVRLISNRIFYSLDYFSDDIILNLKIVCQNKNILNVIKDKSLVKSRSRKIFDYLVLKGFYRIVVLIMRRNYGNVK